MLYSYVADVAVPSVVRMALWHLDCLVPSSFLVSVTSPLSLSFPPVVFTNSSMKNPLNGAFVVHLSVIFFSLWSWPIAMHIISYSLI